MNNPFKNNSLASGLLGFIIGVGSLSGGQALVNNGSDSLIGTMSDNEDVIVSTEKTSSKNKVSFHGLANNPDGDVVITKAGGRYHSLFGCSTLKKSKKFRIVNREDAEAVGLEPCSKCNP